MTTRVVAYERLFLIKLSSYRFRTIKYSVRIYSIQNYWFIYYFGCECGIEIKVTISNWHDFKFMSQLCFQSLEFEIIRVQHFKRFIVKNFGAVLTSTEIFAKGFPFLLVSFYFKSASVTRRKEKLGIHSNCWRCFLDRVRDYLALFNHNNPLHHK